ncbi:MAG: glutamine-hydrolyzing GMP synthase, partial [Owenweeksia sp.]
MQEMILIVDCGSQYTQLIARRVRELNVYCEIHPYNKLPELTAHIKGVIISGSPSSVRDDNSPQLEIDDIKGKLPLLGVCYGAQYLSQKYGGKVEASETREYGRANLLHIDGSSALFTNMEVGSQVWMSHGDTIREIPDNYTIEASTRDVKVAAYRIQGEETYGIQFHPEVYHSKDGLTLLHNFVVGICGCSQDWTPVSFVEDTISRMRKKLGKDQVVLGLSGGVDSTVTAVLLSEAIGDRLHCIFVNNGVLRKNEFDQVLDQ